MNINWIKNVLPVVICSLAVLTISISCSDDLGWSRQTGNEICFDINTNNNWEKIGATRGAGPYEMLYLYDDAGHSDSIAVCVDEGIEGDSPDLDSIMIADYQLGITRVAKTTAITGTVGLNAYTGSQINNLTNKYMDNLEITNQNGTWKPGGGRRYFWPGGEGYASFFAYYPASLSRSSGVSLIEPEDNGGWPGLSYVVGKTPTRQIDVLMAEHPNVDLSAASGAQNLNFKHIMTAVQFRIGSQAFNTDTVAKIKAIRFVNVYDKAVYTMRDFTNSTWGQHEFTNTSNPEKFSYNFTPITNSNLTNTAITSDAVNSTYTFMMIPQTLPSGAKIEVDVETRDLGGGIKQNLTLSAKIEGTVWNKNTTVTYTLQPGKMNVILLASSIEHFSHTGTVSGGNTYANWTVQSFEYTGAGVKTPRKWTAEFRDYDDATGTWSDEWTATPPNWVDYFPTTDNGGSSKTFQIKVKESNDVSGLYGVIQTNHVDVLRNNSVSNEVIDLSKVGFDGEPSTEQNTANCYIVKAGGTYKLPLVYGNAIRHSKVNRDAFHTDNTSSDPAIDAVILKDFKDHLDDIIERPEIYYKYKPTKVGLIWQDHPNGSSLTELIRPNSVTLVDNISFTGKSGSKTTPSYIQFSMVDANKLYEGNAVIGVWGKPDDTSKDQTERLLWSWHIWVTAEPVYDTKTMINREYAEFQVMPHYLGWCYNSETTDFELYPEHRMEVRIKQYAADGVTITRQTSGIIVVQNGGKTDQAEGNCTLYHFGRKDPLLPASGSGAEDKPFTGYNSYTWTITAGPVSIGTSIQNPFTFYTGSDWLPAGWPHNLWHGGQVGAPERITYNSTVIKTVYDPCPVGFHVSPTNAFSGFINAETERFNNSDNYPGSSQYYDDFNVYGTFNKGWVFYLEPNRTGNTLFLQAIGYRGSSNGLVAGYNQQVMYYRATSCLEADGLAMFVASYMNPWDTSNRDHGCPIVPTTDVEGAAAD